MLDFFAQLTARQQSLIADHGSAERALPPYLRWLDSHAPGPVAQRAAEIAGAMMPWQQLLAEYNSASADAPSAFIVEALLQAFPPDPCPYCSAPPVVSVLREAGHGSRRSVVCGVCLAERPSPRLGCLYCGENRVETLPVYRTDATDPARIDACDTCRTYVKTIDLTRDGSACPIADDLASVSLDLWARDQGYRRVRDNLLRL